MSSEFNLRDMELIHSPSKCELPLWAGSEFQQEPESSNSILRCLTCWNMEYQVSLVLLVLLVIDIGGLYPARFTPQYHLVGLLRVLSTSSSFVERKASHTSTFGRGQKVEVSSSASDYTGPRRHPILQGRKRMLTVYRYSNWPVGWPTCWIIWSSSPTPCIRYRSTGMTRLENVSMNTSN